VNAFVQRLAAAVYALKDPRVADVVPALGGLALHFDPGLDGSVIELAASLVEECLAGKLPSAHDERPVVEVPVCYEGEFALDLDEVSEKVRLPKERVIELHCAAEFRVLMIGFAPGHPYMGGLDGALAVPRRANPRAEVPGGSVAIANQQSVIYPYAIAGGWNVIGRTPLAVFDARREAPSLLAAGDRVRFRAISRAEFRSLAK
jgi:inhibitor of KinA